ncbi:MAG TPA: gamma-glutamylcyclotransferase [Dongiaceae bacterium]|jgi:cation transport protein ChaC|nr:gamma-glutamylcyclotransferase [Dongiaceae bacterium]
MSVSDAEKALIESRRHNPEPGKDFFVFAYGSLMWRPDFPFAAVQPATLYGYHRAFCITSTHYRGTTERPGLVLGLDRGGQCVGRLYRIGPSDAASVAEYLHQRELITGCYVPKDVTLRLQDGGKARGLTYVADRAHYQYAGKLDGEKIAGVIRRATGVMGSNRDYLRNTVQHLEEMGIADTSLHRILKLVERGE